MQTTIQQVRNRANGAILVGSAVLVLTGQLADGDTFTLNGTTYEADNNATVTAGNVLVDITGNASVADDYDDIVAAIQANQADGFRAVDKTTYVLIAARSTEPLELAATVVAGSTIVVNAPDAPADDVNLPAFASRAAAAGDVTAGIMAFSFGRPVAAAEVLVRTTAGARKSHDGAVTIDGEVVIVDNSGAADFAATDVVSVFASF